MTVRNMTRTVFGFFLLVLSVPVVVSADCTSGDEGVTAQYRRNCESTISDPDRRQIIHVVLEFYRPPRNQARWLDRRYLPAKPNEAEMRSIDLDFARSLILPLGRGRFCLEDDRAECRSTRGGRIQLSEVYRLDDNSARIVVDFQGAWPHAAQTHALQVFLLTHDRGRWRIIEHLPTSP